MKFYHIVCIFLIILEVPYYYAKTNGQNTVIENIVDVKDFKKLLRTKNNIMVCFTSSTKQSAQLIKVFRDTALAVKGQGTMLLIDCAGEAKKMCKKLKVMPEPHILKHYKDGEFNKDYDRRETVSSMVNFMRDPTGDLPWEEDNSAMDIVHIADMNSLNKILKRESKPVMIMFYAPWCGFCKTLKPEYAAAATELKGHSIMAAIDVNRPENAVVRAQFNITGFPTLFYYQNGQFKYHYEGDTNKAGLVSFMKDPKEAPVKIKEPEWSDTDNEVVHLNTESFDPVLKEEASVLVMFYAPWCGHCKRMKPEYEKAAAIMKNDNVPGMLAALDATKEPTIGSRYDVRGYPTVKYFAYGEFKFDVNVRDMQKIVEFMKDPKEPPPPPPPETPWSEEKSEVVHLTEETYKPFLKKKKHVLVMFYAPWCGHCKKAKPEFTNAAEKFKDDPKVEFAAIDCTLQQSLCSVNDVKGYPTFKYFNYYSKSTKPYNGGRTEADFVRFVQDPENPSANAPELPPKEDWGNFPGSSDVLQLNDDNFSNTISTNEPVLVMFYAPWCGHCRKMKPDYSLAAKELKESGVKVKLAALDCTVNTVISDKYKITGFPTLKLFMGGKYVSDYDAGRSVEELQNYMKKLSNTREEL